MHRKSHTVSRAHQSVLCHNNRLLEQSRLQQCQMRLLSHRLLSAQEDERKRISRELHDVIAQTLTGINVQLTTLKMEATASCKGISRKILRVQRLVEKSVDIVHQFARELRPPVLDDLGLLQSAARQFGWDYPFDPKTLELRAEAWRPWRTVGVWYLWRALDPEPVVY